MEVMSLPIRSAPLPSPVVWQAILANFLETDFSVPPFCCLVLVLCAAPPPFRFLVLPLFVCCCSLLFCLCPFFVLLFLFFLF